MPARPARLARRSARWKRSRLDEAKRSSPNVGEMVRVDAFRQLKTLV
jgi:hypothetical protein